jgi:2-C-methyl-D-erythritol 4-phosphate cytidylyltransferase
MQCSVIIPAGGTGKRFGSELPKQFVELKGIPIIVRTIQLFDEIEEVESIIIPIHSDHLELMQELVKTYKLHKVKEIVVGGIERQNSVYNGLNTNSAKESDIILIHDAVRPFVSKELIKSIIEETEESGAVIPAMKPKETIKEIDNKRLVKKTINRDTLVSVQTPQGFWQDLLIKAFDSIKNSNFIATDDASLLEFIGFKVTIIEGEDSNVKITTPFDLKVAELLLKD